MSDYSNEFCRANQNGIDFLLIDLDVGMTFLRIAEISRNGETVRRNYNNARKAHDTVVRLSKRLRPTAEQRQAIGAKLALLEVRLQAAGD